MRSSLFYSADSAQGPVDVWTYSTNSAGTCGRPDLLYYLRRDLWTSGLTLLAAQGHVDVWTYPTMTLRHKKSVIYSVAERPSDPQKVPTTCKTLLGIYVATRRPLLSMAK